MHLPTSHIIQSFKKSRARSKREVLEEPSVFRLLRARLFSDSSSDYNACAPGVL